MRLGFKKLEEYHVEIHELPQTHQYRFEVRIHQGDVHIETEYVYSKLAAERIAEVYSQNPLRMFLEIKDVPHAIAG
jgi:hypothetical protein